MKENMKSEATTQATAVRAVQAWLVICSGIFFCHCGATAGLNARNVDHPVMVGNVRRIGARPAGELRNSQPLSFKNTQNGDYSTLSPGRLSGYLLKNLGYKNSVVQINSIGYKNTVANYFFTWSVRDEASIEGEGGLQSEGGR